MGRRLLAYRNYNWLFLILLRFLPSWPHVSARQTRCQRSLVAEDRVLRDRRRSCVGAHKQTGWPPNRSNGGNPSESNDQICVGCGQF